MSVELSSVRSSSVDLGLRLMVENIARYTGVFIQMLAGDVTMKREDEENDKNESRNSCCSSLNPLGT